ncbi:YggS family pyridoxal phosphate-dependent enzyme [Fulvimarina endophytica]|uniref:Pyridoxal phosphate homeostasis protein n=1 Tax=Fulvimarina endophytica TaxID=2293836 RepID=A0A371X010_9HYPH|nr:YggS family pyridoxal phosphate-dependent enzyme [Fulvimarina endophytica]RFC62570.1 YggS family pyridoxal phosphate-dependent enzyme [Fulvimarina endophytica]
MSSADQYHAVTTAIENAAREAGRAPGSVALVAISKTKGEDEIVPVLQAGQRIFGENKVQESQAKWPPLKERFADIELRLVGPLQSNKTADAVALFDVIESVDREKIAREIAKEMAKQDRRPRLYVQVNIGEEEQKSGIMPKEAVAFVERCRSEHGLTIEGLMCIPPVDENPGPYFALLAKLAKEAGLDHLSMGMSGDYETAIAFGATSVRVGSAIFGARDDPAA